MSSDDPNIHQQLGKIIQAVETLQDGMGSISEETSQLKDNSIKLTGIVDQIAPIVAAHEEIAGSIKKEYIPRLDEHHAYIEMLITKAAFWRSVREQMVRRGAIFSMFCVLAGVAYLLGWDDIAKKLANLGG